MWTLQNTEGFDQAELDTINATIERIVQVAGGDLEQEWIDAAISNEWIRGMTGDELHAAVTKRLGISV